MKSFKVSIGLALFFGIFIGGLALHFSSEGELEFASYGEQNSFLKRALTAKSKKQTAAERELEISKITSQSGRVEDEPSALFNDPAISQVWGLKKSDAARAWSITQGSHEIVVAVIDTGIDIKHEDLQGNFWTNPGESGLDENGKDKATNKIDDDKNGFVDDVHGWNFVSNNNILTDNHGHGTHIAGTIGAAAGNKKGISGISPKVSLMILKYFDPKVPTTDNLKNTISAINYAVKMQANIINYSGGGIEYSKEEHDAVAEAEKKGILFVAAAGNERSNSDKNHYYPADYKLDNIVSVTAYDPAVEVLASSNYGIETVDIAAPGQNVLSTLPGNNYGYMTGTSQATAFVSGAAVLVMAHQKNYKYDFVKKYILKTGDAVTSLADKTRTSRKLNLYKALVTLDQNVGATGVIATNTGKSKAEYSSDPKKSNEDLKDNATQVTEFGKSLMEAMSKKNKQERIGQKPEGDSN